MKPLKKKVSVCLDENIIESFKTLAEKEDRSFSQYVNYILLCYLRKIGSPIVPTSVHGGGDPM